MYIIPVGQNPTGAVNMPFLEILTGPELTCSQRLCWLRGRKRYMIFASNLVEAPQLTDVTVSNCCADIVIVEDDPYYFLQEGPYTLPSERSGKSEDSALRLDDSDEEYIASLAPSFLSYVYFELPLLYLICFQDSTTKDG
jgi:hypothetical protein